MYSGVRDMGFTARIRRLRATGARRVAQWGRGGGQSRDGSFMLDNPGVACRIAQRGKEWEPRFHVEWYQRETCDFLESLKGEC
jgi:hypothetical protein